METQNYVYNLKNINNYLQQNQINNFNIFLVHCKTNYNKNKNNIYINYQDATKLLDMIKDNHNFSFHIDVKENLDRKYHFERHSNFLYINPNNFEPIANNNNHNFKAFKHQPEWLKEDKPEDAKDNQYQQKIDELTHIIKEQNNKTEVLKEIIKNQNENINSLKNILEQQENNINELLRINTENKHDITDLNHMVKEQKKYIDEIETIYGVDLKHKTKWQTKIKNYSQKQKKLKEAKLPTSFNKPLKIETHRKVSEEYMTDFKHVLKEHQKELENKKIMDVYVYPELQAKYKYDRFNRILYCQEEPKDIDAFLNDIEFLIREQQY